MVTRLRALLDALICLEAAALTGPWDARLSSVLDTVRVLADEAKETEPMDSVESMPEDLWTLLHDRPGLEAVYVSMLWLASQCRGHDDLRAPLLARAAAVMDELGPQRAEALRRRVLAVAES